MTDRDRDIFERFQHETAEHSMTILHDDGLYRHIRFSNRKRGWAYWFELVTIPGALIFRGDGETFAFSRITDMFEFFRGPIGRINPQYWAEKLTTDRNSVMTYDERRLAEYVAEDLAEAEKDYPGITDAWNEKTDGFMPDYYTNNEHEAREALDDFEFGVIYRATCACGASAECAEEYDATRWRSDHITPENTRRAHSSSVKRIDGFRFSDTWEWRLKDYNWWFLWACQAIVWGITCYDEQKKAAAKQAISEAAASRPEGAAA